MWTFFCKKCIEEQSTDDEGIKFSNDNLLGKHISEQKILNNLKNFVNITNVKH